ncbi:MAG: CCA tRNA nucleotidyltransferase [Patescibacteria group bacterium]
MQTLHAITQRKELGFLSRLKRDFPQSEIYLVGGIVRDALLRRPSKDYDFVIRGIPLKKLQTWLQRHGQVDLVGRRFGVLKFLPSNTKLRQPIDIALPRTEHAGMSGAYRDVTVQSDYRLPIESDLQRRDFTINALAYDVRQRTLLDLHRGQRDLKKKIIRTVGIPSQRFAEDYSRMLRAIRFACQLGFAIEPDTRASIRSAMRHINKKIKGEYTVPRETIAAEFVKTFVASPVAAFDLYDELGCTAQLMPEMLVMKGCPQPPEFHAEGDVWTHTRLCLRKLSAAAFKKKFSGEQLTPELIVALLWHDIGKPATLTRADRLRFNNHDIVGADIASRIMQRLKIASAGVDTEQVNWLIRRHMIVASSKHSPMKKTTIEKYFYSSARPGTALLMLSYADIQATIFKKNNRPDATDYRQLERQIRSIKPRHGAALPAELLSGHDIMRMMKLKPGPRIGTLKAALREAQLAGEIRTASAARQWLQKKS